METAGFNASTLLAAVRKMHEKVVADLKAASLDAVCQGKVLKPLKLPRAVKRESLWPLKVSRRLSG